MKAKETKKGLPIKLLSIVRKEVIIKETTFLGVKIYKVEGKTMPEIYAETLNFARLVANSARVSLANSMVKKKIREKKETIINL